MQPYACRCFKFRLEGSEFFFFALTKSNKACHYHHWNLLNFQTSSIISSKARYDKYFQLYNIIKLLITQICYACMKSNLYLWLGVLYQYYVHNSLLWGRYWRLNSLIIGLFLANYCHRWWYTVMPYFPLVLRASSCKPFFFLCDGTFDTNITRLIWILVLVVVHANLIHDFNQ